MRLVDMLYYLLQFLDLSLSGGITVYSSDSDIIYFCGFVVYWYDYGDRTDCQEARDDQQGVNDPEMQTITIYLMEQSSIFRNPLRVVSTFHLPVELQLKQELQFTSSLIFFFLFSDFSGYRSIS